MHHINSKSNDLVVQKNMDSTTNNAETAVRKNSSQNGKIFESWVTVVDGYPTTHPHEALVKGCISVSNCKNMI